MRTLRLVALFVVAAAGSAGAQAGSGARTPGSIDPGMTKDQVIAKLGKPASEHSNGTSTYLYYSNGQEKTVGMSDMVALDDGKVVDAVFRSKDRHYTGKSSSPKPVSRDDAIVKGGGKVPVKHAPEKIAAKAPMKTETKAPAKPAGKAEAKAPAKTPAKEPAKAAPAAKAPAKAPPATIKTAPDTKKTAPTPTKKP